MVWSEAQSSHKHHLQPDHAKLQFAGNIGFLSLAAGYANRKQSLEGELFYGYVPRPISSTPLHNAGVKIDWLPFHIDLTKRAQLKPLMIGALGSYTFRSNRFRGGEEQEPFTYYDHPGAVHAGVFLGSQFNCDLGREHGVKRIGVYYELVSFDTDILNYIGNKKALGLDDIVSLGIGIRIAFQ
ncbi:MAG: hypothetical protein JWP88_1215 [Flaviaesturariibacter sp.]|nr:hypothetical protein [Flaviaesturariibacter sp.]